MFCPACFPCCQLDALHGHLTRKRCWKHRCCTSNWKDIDGCTVPLGGDEDGMMCSGSTLTVPRSRPRPRSRSRPLCCRCSECRQSAAAEKLCARDRPIGSCCSEDQGAFSTDYDCSTSSWLLYISAACSASAQPAKGSRVEWVQNLMMTWREKIVA